MKRFWIILITVMFISAIFSTLFFFISGMFDFSYGYVTGENAKTILYELEEYVFFGLKNESSNKNYEIYSINSNSTEIYTPKN